MNIIFKILINNQQNKYKIIFQVIFGFMNYILMEIFINGFMILIMFLLFNFYKHINNYKMINNKNKNKNKNNIYKNQIINFIKT